VAPNELRHRVFWTVLALIALAAILGHLSENYLSYEINYRPGESENIACDHLPMGSYGLYLARYPREKSPDLRRVVLLGNSIYQYCGVAERLQELANQSGAGVEFVNLAQTGSGIHDYIVQLASVADHRPDLAVVTFINLAFTTDYSHHTNALPLFRSDSDLLACEPRVVRVLPGSFYRREIERGKLSRALLATICPLIRLDTVLRVEVSRRLGLDRISWFQKTFVPTLNLAADWQDWHRAWLEQEIYEHEVAYVTTPQLLDELIQVARERDIGILFLRQESGPEYRRPDVMTQVRKACRSYDQAFAVDLIDEYREEEIIGVHPVAEAVPQYADRHYEVIIRYLDQVSPREGAR